MIGSPLEAEGAGPSVTAAPPPHVGPVGASWEEVGVAWGLRRPLGVWGEAPGWA